jgi:hypothetical protein
MALLERIFGTHMPRPPLTPPSGRTRIAPAQIQSLIDELSTIGRNEGFLALRPGGRYNEQCRHRGARAIGARLHALGGLPLMRRVYDRLECPRLQQLAAAWDGVGGWQFS